ncbi:MAG: type IV secretion system DNA-binding domain-containing protein [Acidimicrobiales bacterium]
MKLGARPEEWIIGGLLGAGAGLAVTAPLALLAGPLPGLLPHDLAAEPLWAAAVHALMLGTAVACAAAGVWIAARQASEEHIEGVEYLSSQAAAAQALQSIQRADMSDEQRAGKVRGLALGGIELSRSAETKHLLLVGLQGGGKTVLINALLDQAAARGERRIIFDPKKDFVRAYFDPSHVVLLGPWDERSVVWDAAGDFDEPSLAYEFCNVLYQVAARPEHKRWVGGAARVLSGLIIAEMVDARVAKRSAAWSWSSIAAQVASLGDVDMIKRAARGDSTLRTLFPSAFSTGKLTRDEVSVLSTLPEGIDVIRMLAATDSAKPDALRFSLRRWLSGTAHAEIDTIILNYDENYKVAGGLIFGAMLDVISSTINSSLPEKSADEPGGLWAVFDEAPQLGAEGLVKLQSLAAVGRSRGTRVVIAAQDESYFAALLGRDKADLLLALAGTRLYSQTSPGVARAICDRAGDRKIIQITNTASGGARQGKVAETQIVPAILPSVFTGLAVRRRRWYRPWSRTGAEIILQSGNLLGRLLQPFGARHPDIAPMFVPCHAWAWGEHHNAGPTRSNAPQPTPPTTDGGRAPEPQQPQEPAIDPDIESPFIDTPAPEPDEPSPFDDPSPAQDDDAIDWTKEF